MKPQISFILLFVGAASAERSSRDGLCDMIKFATEIPGGERMAGGENVTEPIPYHAGIYLSGSFCSGVLIHKQWVVTTAQCGHLSSEPLIILGAVNICENETTQLVVPGDPPIVHPEWSPSYPQYYYNIALIKLSHPVNTTDAIKPAKLPTADGPDYVGMVARVTGWGYTHLSATRRPSILQVVENPIISNGICAGSYGHVGDFIGSAWICQDGSNRKGTCFGDGGDPLTVIDESNEIVVVGYSAFYSDIYSSCGQGYPSVFSRLGYYRLWIDKTIQGN